MPGAGTRRCALLYRDTTGMQTLLRLLLLVTILALGLLVVRPTAQAQSRSPTSEPSGERPPEVMDLLRERGRYSTLIDALKRTGIDQGLAMSPSFTLLAPTDSAFAALGVRRGYRQMCPRPARRPGADRGASRERCTAEPNGPSPDRDRREPRCEIGDGERSTTRRSRRTSQSSYDCARMRRT